MRNDSGRDRTLKLAVFDFDGTLADTFNLFVDIFDRVAATQGFRSFDRENATRLRALEAGEILRHHGVPIWRLPSVVHAARQLMAERIHEARLFEGVVGLLPELHSQGLKLALLSSNSRSNVLRLLPPETAALFSHLECGSSLFGKARRLKKLVAQAGVAAAETIFIGDEVRDAAAAQKAGVRFWGVAWGYNDVESLRRSGASHCFLTPEELATRVREHIGPAITSARVSDAPKT